MAPSLSRSLNMALIAASLVLGACSSTKEIDEPKELAEFEPSAKLEKLWSAGVGAGQDRRYTQLVPALTPSAVVASDVEGQVVALDAESGKRLWRTKLKVPVSGGVGYGAGLILLGTYDGEVIALDANDGSEKWRARVSSEVLSPPQTNGDVVVVQSFDGRLHGLDQETGAARWLFETTMPLLTLRGNAAPVLVGDTIYVGFATGKVVAIQAADGLQMWEQRIAIPQGRSPLDRIVDIDGAPLLVGDLLFSGSYQGQLVALSRATGRVLWFKPESTYQNLAAASGNVYVTDASSAVKAYSAGSGNLVWTNEELLYRELTAPHAVQGFVAVAENEGGYLHLLRQVDGAMAARMRIDRDGVRSPIVGRGDVIYVLSNDGDLVALRVSAIEASE